MERGEAMIQEALRFDGATIDPELDNERLGAQLKRVWELMKDGTWRSLREIAQQTGDPESSISARLRDWRKPRNGSHTVERRRIAGGLYEYRLLITSKQYPD
jgi:hypothetical protein